ncbi:MAG TPA: polyprenyl synthetase family protein, partial [Ktedonobacterales bacterium]|nr:polyprenyl synthetase family protein [Ktedonobacterales bacterium]
RYLDRIERKTACLIAGCCKGGAMVCGASDEIIERMRLFGHYLGVAFQIIDDVLDYQGTEAIIGKPAGNDLRQGMVTLPLIYALDAHNNGHLAHVRSIVEDPTQHQDLVPLIVDWVNAGPANDRALAEARRYAGKAQAILTSFPPSDDRQTLEEIVDFIVQREH